MSETSPNLDLPLVMPAQAQKHITVNEALLRLDGVVQLRAESRGLTVQPASPVDGQAWILPPAASGADWSAYAAGDIASYRDGAWSRLQPRNGWSAYIADENAECRFDGTGWRRAGVGETLCEGDQGAATRAVIREETLTGLNGANLAAIGLIPARAVVFCVSVTVSEAVTGAASFDCGIPGEAAKFGGLLGVSTGASNLGVIGPTAFYSDTDIVLTANGAVRIAVHAWLPQAPAV